MFLEEVSVINESSGRRVRRYAYECDQCHVRFVYERLSSQKRFCGRSCLNESQRSGVVRQEKEQHFLQTLGVKNPWSASSVIEARKALMVERYGVENPSQLQLCKDAKATTFMLHHGSSNNFGRPEVRKKIEATLMQRFGSLAPTTHPSVIEKLRSPEVRAKRFASWKKSGSIRSSAPERRVVSMLMNVFTNVRTHVSVNGWSIDVHVPAVNVYVQVDGVWWHGLDRDLTIILEKARNGSAVDAEILRKRSRDEAQNVWFEDHGMRLVRLTDVAVNSMDDLRLRQWCLALEERVEV